MAITSIKEFWKLACSSRLFSQQECHQLHQSFKRNEGSTDSLKSLVNWLVDERQLTNYQARALLAGNAGPFFFSDYKVLQHLPYGDVTRLFSAVHVPTDHKVLAHFWATPESLSDEAWAEACEWAGRHAGVVHPNLSRCYETITRSKHKIAITENPKGNNVAAILNRDGSLPVARACEIVRQAALGLDFLHQADLVHGRVQTNSLCLQSNGHVKLMRHPIITAAPIDFELPDPKGRMLARADFFAPELHGPDTPLSSATDIYALGCTLYTLLIGRPPFAGGKVDEKMVRHAREPIEPLEASIKVPDGLDDVVSFMMAKNRHLRLKTAAEVAERLEPFATDDVTTTPMVRSAEARFLTYIAKKKRSETNSGSIENAAPPAPPSNNQIIADPNPFAPTPVVITQNVGPSRGHEPVDAAAEPIAVANTPSVRSMAQQRRGSLWWLIAAAVIGGCASIVIISFVLRQLLVTNTSNSTAKDSSQIENRVGPTDGTPPVVLPDSSTNGDGTSSRIRTANQNDIQIVPDDGKSLWLSPTDGKPISLQFLPPGVQLVVVVNVHDVLENEEGEKIFRAIGPSFVESIEASLARFELRLQDIATAVVGYTPQDTGPPAATWHLRFSDDVDFSTWIERMTRQEEDGGVSVSVGGKTLFAPLDSNSIVIGSPADVRQVIEVSGRVPLLNRDVERLRQATDQTRHFTSISTRNFLAVEGPKLFAGKLASLFQSLEETIGEEANAVSLSLHVSDHLYGELGVSLQARQDVMTQAKEIGKRVNQIPAKVSGYLEVITIDRHWQGLAIRFPRMLGQLADRVRTAVNPGYVVANFVMPKKAAHNLVLASELTLSAPTNELPSVLKRRITAVDLLKQPIDFSFPQQSLEDALRDLQIKLADDYPENQLSIEIAGSDLQAEGITRNQQIRDFAVTNESVERVLTKIVMRANPDQTVQSASDTKQKLVWVVSPEMTNNTSKIIITTRQAAVEKQYKLPSAFATK